MFADTNTQIKQDFKAKPNNYWLEFGVHPMFVPSSGTIILS